MAGDTTEPSDPARPSVGSVVGTAAVGGDVNMQGGVVAGRDIRIDQLQQTTVLPTPVPGLSGRLQLPRDVGDFTGRTDELDQITALLELAREQSPTATPVLLVNGMPGVGKSALGLHLAHLLRDDYPDAQLYVRLSGVGEPTVTAADALDRWLRALGVQPEQLPGSFEERVDLYRTLLAKQRALVLLDNALDHEQVEPLRPATAGSLVLVTSRSDLSGTDGVTPYRLQPMATGEGVELLGRLVGVERVAADQDAAEQVVQLCGGLPLAIRLAGASLATTATRNLPLSRLEDRLTDARRRLDELDEEADGRRAVRASFQLSYEQLPGQLSLVFRWLSLLQVADVAAGVVAALVDVGLEDAKGWLRALANAQLVEPVGPTGERYRLHDLLALYADELAEKDPSEDRQAAVKRALAWYRNHAQRMDDLLNVGSAELEQLAQGDSELAENAQVDPAGVQATLIQQALDWFEVEQASLVSVQRQAAQLGEHQTVWKLAISLFRFFDWRKHWGDWQATQELALEVARELGDSAAQCRFLDGLGTAFGQQRRFVEAVTYFEQSLMICAEGGDRYREAWVRCHLGIVCAQQGRLVESVASLEQSLVIFRELRNRNGESQTLNNLALVYSQQEKHVEAAAHLEQNLVIFRELGNRYREGQTLNNLGNVYSRQRRLVEAIACCEQNLVICRELGDRHGEAMALHNLGMAYEAQGARDRAEQYVTQALAIYQELQAPETDRVAAWLAELHRPRGLRSVLTRWRRR
jgi:tetratricopeptide (TPR) repeat protein